MTGMLASVRNVDEARQVLFAGADIIDLKQPAAGALGALSTDEVRKVLRSLDRRVPISATIGDMPMDPYPLRGAVKAMAETGVDYVKVGFFPDGNWDGSIHALAKCAENGAKLIAVLFADGTPDIGVISQLAKAGFAGVMLDTMDKAKGSLREIYNPLQLATFVREAIRHRLLCGLAGSLRETDIEPLQALSPHYLGFRGALCRGSERTDMLDPSALAEIRARVGAVPASQAALIS